MARSKRLHPYPTMKIDQKQLFFSFLIATREDFAKGYDRMKIMAKISQEPWIMNNIEYFRHCVNATDYQLDKLRLPIAKARK